jgi:hypothetical protein
VPEGAEDDDAVGRRIGALLDDAVSAFGPAVADILAAYKEGVGELLAALETVAATEGCVWGGLWKVTAALPLTDAALLLPCDSCLLDTRRLEDLRMLVFRFDFNGYYSGGG